MVDLVVVGGGEDPGILGVLAACGVTYEVARSSPELFAGLDVWCPAAVMIVLDPAGHHLAQLPEITARLPIDVRLIVVGDPRASARATTGRPPGCIVFAELDEPTLDGVLAHRPPPPLEVMLEELLGATVLGGALPTALQAMTARVARGFDADDCVLVLAEDTTCYSARELSDDALRDLVPLADTVVQLGTTLIARSLPGRPYRAFLGVPVAHDDGPPLGMLVLCRERPVPFERATHAHLRTLVRRISADLSWRLVQERLLADRDRLGNASRVDPVLGVANRQALNEELAQRVAVSERAGEPFSVAILDVDGLRLINERYGYPTGDAVLAHVAHVARDTVSPRDVVARYAGDAVAVVMPGVAADTATAVLTRILSAIDATPVMHERAAVHLTVSAGIAELQYEGDTGEGALGRAMAARRRARLHGNVIAVADAAIEAEAAAPIDFAIGTTLGGVYQLRHEISRGAFGVVYRAEDLALGRQVALKLLRSDLARDTAFVERFRAEAATLAHIRNPNLVQVYAFGVDGEDVFFAMELVEGQGLDERIAAAQRHRRHLLLPEVIGFVEQVGEALEAVHRAGVLHRDVKPENVLIDRINRRCVLVDVGIAVKRGSEKNPAGTPGFTAPEVFGPDGETPATDVYSLGALAYLLLTLQAPFGDASPLEILYRQSQRPQPPSAVRRDLPRAVDEVLLSALDPDPRRRPQSARTLARTLAAALAPSIATASSRSRRAQPRMTLEPPPLEKRVTIRNQSLRGAPELVPRTRGLLFRSAYEVLGARQGSAWVAALSRRTPALEPALATNSSALAWHPTSWFLDVLESLGADARNGPALATQLGRTAVAASFDRFYGADPSTLSPARVLLDADMYWHCYHSWGAVAVTAGAGQADVVLTADITSSLLCASTAGLLAGMITRAGGLDVDVAHRSCVAAGGDRCVFHLTWQGEAATPRGARGG